MKGMTGALAGDAPTREPLGHEALLRNGFIATLDARTWRPRAHAAAALADPAGVSDRGAYVAWLRRAATAWSRLPRPAAGPWPFRAVGPRCLALLPEIEADLRDLTDPAAPSRASLPRPRSAARVDDAFMAGAAYVAVVAAADAAVLAEAATALVANDAAGTRFLRSCRELAPVHGALRRELAGWAAIHGPEAADRAVLTARALSLAVAQALQGIRQGW